MVNRFMLHWSQGFSLYFSMMLFLKKKKMTAIFVLVAKLKRWLAEGLLPRSLKHLTAQTSLFCISGLRLQIDKY